ncbi:sigma-Y antisigma factor component [Cytobacillus horneckiae]|nr:sigma-Y antisigma factor component [Cytobacillus horneckiae]MBN6887679.1 sigma-Y antisigma factor component [Cytobacillus horneckiae]MEC1158212.1 sigma-Y antisigma factor component [Cytobacillus horneckiae]MED2940144.1 sigma-Y antisigma factor component [Cytobacillus horneckiae]NRG45854.1 sigma-Y antisigma factor component [Bacillus sp. CRN 9]
MDAEMLLVFITCAIILISQSLFLFINARKHGHNYWLWGILGLIQAPMPTLFYLLFARKLWRSKKKK